MISISIGGLVMPIINLLDTDTALRIRDAIESGYTEYTAYLEDYLKIFNK